MICLFHLVPIELKPNAQQDYLACGAATVRPTVADGVAMVKASIGNLRLGNHRITHTHTSLKNGDHTWFINWENGDGLFMG